MRVAAGRSPSPRGPQGEAPQREQQAEQQQELPEPADDPVERPVGPHRVRDLPDRPGEQRREQQRPGDRAEEPGEPRASGVARDRREHAAGGLEGRRRAPRAVRGETKPASNGEGAR